MILALMVSLIVVAAILFLGRRLSFGVRLAFALCAFVLLNLPTIMFLVINDKPPADARVAIREELAESP